MPGALSKATQDSFVNVVHHNVRGLRAIVRNANEPKLELVRGYLSRFSIVCLTETWVLKEEEFNFDRVFGCKYTTSPATKDKRNGGRNSGGVAILWKDGVPIKPLAAGKFFCSVQVECEFGSLVLVCVYLPYDGRTAPINQKFSRALNQEVSGYLDSLDSPFVSVIGDFNCDVSKSSNARKNATDRFLHQHSHRFVDLDYDIPYTFEHENGSTSYVDHISATDSMCNKIALIDVEYNGDQVSDHHPMFMNLHGNFLTPENASSVGSTQVDSVVKTVSLARVKQCHINCFRDRFRSALSKLPSISETLSCLEPTCSGCIPELCEFASGLVSAFSHAAECLPTTKPPHKHTKAGWDDDLRSLKSRSIFWSNLWNECSRPMSGHIFDIKRKVCKEYKVGVRVWLRRQKELRQERAAEEYVSDPTNACNRIFQSRSKLSKSCVKASRVDDFTEPTDIANAFAANYSAVFNVSKDEDAVLPEFGITRESCAQIFVTEQTVLSAVRSIKAGKSDDDRIFSDYIRWVRDILAKPFATFVTCCFRHGCLPSAFADATICPIPKKGKDPESSDGYRCIALASQLSKLVEYIVIELFGHCLLSSDLQFSYKRNTGTTVCSAVYKTTVEHFVAKGIPVYSALLDMSRAFDFVRHDKLDECLEQRGLHKNMRRFFYNWYKSQYLRVRYNNRYSVSFPVGNGVRQGGVVSPLMFTVYMDILLSLLEKEGAGCHIDSTFFGAVCYADDITLTAPSLSSLRRMLSICEKFSVKYGMKFNAAKSQLIRFGCPRLPTAGVYFVGTRLEWVSKVTHLGVEMTNDMKDDTDISRVCARLYACCYTLLSQFPHLDPIFRTRIFNILACDLYGSVIWRFTVDNLVKINVAYNNCLRKIWSVSLCHTNILRSMTRTVNASVLVKKRAAKFLTGLVTPNASSQRVAQLMNFILVNGSVAYTVYQNKFRAKFPMDPVCTEESDRSAAMVREIRTSPGIFKFFGYANCKYVVEYLCWGTRV